MEFKELIKQLTVGQLINVVVCHANLQGVHTLKSTRNCLVEAISYSCITCRELDNTMTLQNILASDIDSGQIVVSPAESKKIFTMIPLTFDAIARKEKIITRDGREYKFGAFDETKDEFSQIIGWIEGRVCGHSVNGKLDRFGDMPSDLFVHPKETKWYYNLYLDDFFLNLSNRRGHSIEECKEDKIRDYICIIETHTIGNHTSTSIVYQYP